MYLVQCKSPKIIRNKFGVLMSVPCGKCEVCRNRQHMNWIQRLYNESSVHPLSLFVTLTYDEQFCPRAYLLDDCIVSTPNNDYIEQYVINDFKEVSNDFIRVLNYEDTTKFIKRLRNELRKYFPNEKVRYFYTGEYGSHTRRPHYHFLLFVDSYQVAQKITELIPSLWQYGIVDSSYSKGSASEYVAKYLNVSGYLPKIYELPDIKQKSLFSKCPPLGLYRYSEKDFEELFDSEVNAMCVITNGKAKTSELVPLWRPVQSKLFPKCKGFSKLSHSERVTLYGLFDYFAEETYAAFLFALYESKTLSLDHYIYQLLKKCDFFNLRKPSENELKQLFYTSRRVCNNARLYHVSLDYYVTKIENYWSLVSLERLKSQYEYLQDISKDQSIYEWALWYSDILNFYRDFTPLNFTEYSLIQNFFAYDEIKKIDYKTLLDYKVMLSKHRKVSNDSQRRKHVNSYYKKIKNG